MVTPLLQGFADVLKIELEKPVGLPGGYVLTDVYQHVLRADAASVFG